LLALSPVDAVHLLTSTIVHGLLLLLELTDALANRHATGHGTLVGLALSSVDLQQRPDSFADIAPTGSLDGAGAAVLQQALHLCTVGGRTFRSVASGGVKEECHVQLDTTLSFLTLGLGEFVLIATCNRDRLERMRMALDIYVLIAFLALIEFTAD
jgi:hypothetical protein